MKKKKMKRIVREALANALGTTDPGKPARANGADRRGQYVAPQPGTPNADTLRTSTDALADKYANETDKTLREGYSMLLTSRRDAERTPAEWLREADALTSRAKAEPNPSLAAEYMVMANRARAKGVSR